MDMRPLLILLAAAVIPAAARADEVDDELAKRLSMTARDPRLSIHSRVEAAKTLGKLGTRASAAVPDLVAVLNRLRGAEQEPLQEAIVDALGHIGAAARPTLPTLARASGRTTDIDQAIKRSTELILTSPDDQEIGTLVKQLGSMDPSIRLRAVKALSALGPVAAPTLPLLAVLLADPDADVRRGAISAVRRIDPNGRPTEPLIRAIAVDLSDPDPNRRLFAVRTLGQIGPAATIVAVEIDGLRADPDPDVRRAATEALARISAP
jgi:HEAT repeat protein